MKTKSLFFNLLLLLVACSSGITSQAQVKLLDTHPSANEYETAAVSAFAGVAVAALQKPTGEMRLASYLVGNDGKITPCQLLDYGTVKKVNVTMLASNRSVVATRGNDGKLKITVFSVSNTGKFTKLGEKTGDAIKHAKPAIARLSSSTFVTGVVLSTGKLRLTTWAVSGNGSLTKKDDDDAGAVDAVDLTTMSATRIVAGVRLASSDQLKLIAFDLNGSQTIYRRGDFQFGGAVRRISIVRAGDNDLLAFSVDTGKRLGVSSLTINGSGNFIHKDTDDNVKSPETNNAYALNEIDAQFLGDGKIVVNAISTSGKMKVIPFQLSANNTVAVKSGEFTSENLYTLAYAAATGGKLVAFNRLMTNKYMMSIFRWS